MGDDHEITHGMSSGYRILIVDDEPVVLQHLAWIFERDGRHSVVTTSSATKAVSLLEQEVFDLAIVDLVMPGFSGLELAGG